MFNDRFVNEFWDFVLDQSVVVDDISLIEDHAQEDRVEESVANSHFAFHDIENFKHFTELILYYIFINIVISGLQMPQQLHNMEPILQMIEINKFKLFIISFIPECVPKHVQIVSKQMININILL